MIRARRAVVEESGSQARTVRAAFGNTIVSLPKHPSLRSLCVEEGETLQPQASADQKIFKIRLADSRGHCEAASVFVKRRYAWRGYQVGGINGTQPNRVTFSAADCEEIIAAISVGLDSMTGLFVDKLYGEEVDQLRTQNRRVCEFTKLAIEAGVRSKSILAALFHIAYIHARRINRCTDLVVEVNPRHASFYKHMLGFADCGSERLDPRVGATAVLLRLDLAFAEREIAEMGGRLELASTKRSLYPYFFAANEEMAVERRLRTVAC